MEGNVVETEGDFRLRYLCYRCYLCGRLLTKTEILALWDRNDRAFAENGTTSSAICPCGSNKISPTNPLWWEELLLPRVWKLWWVERVRPWLKAKLHA